MTESGVSSVGGTETATAAAAPKAANGRATARVKKREQLRRRYEECSGKADACAVRVLEMERALAILESLPDDHEAYVRTGGTLLRMDAKTAREHTRTNLTLEQKVVEAVTKLKTETYEQIQAMQI